MEHEQLNSDPRLLNYYVSSDEHGEACVRSISCAGGVLHGPLDPDDPGTSAAGNHDTALPGAQEDSERRYICRWGGACSVL